MPLFMIGTQRSGSNLLRLMLNQLPGIVAPHPPHVLQRLMPLLPLYGELQADANFVPLVDDVCRLIEVNPVPWDLGGALDRQDILRRCRERSLVAVYGAVYDAFAEARGARSWCCKSLANVHYLDEIERYFGDEARYLYLYRDGRDVACSFRKAVVGEKHFYHVAREWAETQRLALAHRSRIPAGRFFSVSYEEITADPRAALRRLCRFLGVRYRAEMLEFHRSDEARRAAAASALWGNVVRPVMAGNTHKFLRETDPAEVRIFEWVAGDMLDALGYARSLTARGETRSFVVPEVRRFDEENRRLKAQVLDDADPEDRRRRDRQEALLADIRARLEGAHEAPEREALWIEPAGGTPGGDAGQAAATGRVL